MKPLKLFLQMSVVITAAIMVGCAQYEQPEDVHIISDDSFEPVLLTPIEAIALKVKSKGTYAISESEALDKLHQFVISGKEGTSDLKSAGLGNMSAFTVKSASLKKSSKTGKNMYYEFAFDNDKGYALVSADERISDVLYYSERVPIADTLFNKGLKFCLKLVDLYVEEQTKEELDIDALVFSANNKLKKTKEIKETYQLLRTPEPVLVGSYTVETGYSERVKPVPGGWHQDSPYNNLLPFVPGIETLNGRAAVGCSMIAVSQIMGYHKKEYSKYGNVVISTTNWNSIVSSIHPGTVTLLQNLMEDLFNEMKITYGVDGTSSNIGKARDFLNNKSHHNFTIGAASNYSFSGVWSALYDGPTYMQGFDSNGDGHAWVVDGASQRHFQIYNTYLVRVGRLEYYEDYPAGIYTLPSQLRFDWGYDYGNGWLAEGVFQVLGYNYNSNLKIIDYVK